MNRLKPCKPCMSGVEEAYRANQTTRPYSKSDVSWLVFPASWKPEKPGFSSGSQSTPSNSLELWKNGESEEFDQIPGIRPKLASTSSFRRCMIWPSLSLLPFFGTALSLLQVSNFRKICNIVVHIVRVLRNRAKARTGMCLYVRTYVIRTPTDSRAHQL